MNLVATFAVCISVFTAVAWASTTTETSTESSTITTSTTVSSSSATTSSTHLASTTANVSSSAGSNSTIEHGNFTTIGATSASTTELNVSTESTEASTSASPTPKPLTTNEATTVTTNAATTQTSSKSDTAVIVLATVIPVAALVILALVVYFNRSKLRTFIRRICGSNTDDDKLTSSDDSLVVPEKTSIPVQAGDFLDYLEDMGKECDFKYAEQFESLQMVGRDQATSHAVLKCNVEKNRYVNIHPYDITRVKLLPIESEEGSDYINASWIPGYYSKREYIAAQGPLPSTEDDMWRMIWEYKCKGVIMLTKCMEAGRRKCDQYWPDDTEPVVYGDIEVKLVGESSEDDKWTIKKFEISLGSHKRFMKLFHFIDWPDSGVPQSVDLVLDFMNVVKSELETSSGPLVVHCSAGVGRTGTYIAIETLLQQLDNENIIDTFGVVYRLRMNRVFMVQTERQLKFIHEAIGHVISKRQERAPPPIADGDITIYTNSGEQIPLEEVRVQSENLGTTNAAFDATST